MKPCPCDLEKFLHTPLNSGPDVARTVAEYVRVRLVGRGLGNSPGWGGFLSLSHTLLPSLRKGKDRTRGVRGDGSGMGMSAGEEGLESAIF